jgi:hypothetical protein
MHVALLTTLPISLFGDPYGVDDSGLCCNYLNSVTGSAVVGAAEPRLFAYDELVESRSVYDDGPQKECLLVEPYG